MAETQTTFDPKTWGWWKAAKEQKKKGVRRPDLPVHDGVLHQGFYAAKRAKGGDLLPVAIWYNGDGDLKCTIGADDKKPMPASKEQAYKVWLACCYNPIDEAVFRSVVAGAPWPEEIIITYEDGRIDSSMKGHNKSDDNDTILDDIQEWIDRATKFKKKGAPQNKVEADAIADVASKLGELCSEADKVRTLLNRPLLDQQNANNTKFNAKINPGKSAVRDLKTLINIYIDKEDQKRREEEAARRQKEMEEAASKAPSSGELIPDPEPPKRQAAPPRVQVGTRRAISQRVRKVLVWEGDETAARKAALLHFLNTMENLRPDLAGIIDTMARNMLENGMKVPGATLKEETSAV